MFRKKDEDAQEELDVMNNSENKTDTGNRNAQGGFQPSSGARPAGAAPAAPTGYRPPQGATPAGPAGRPAAPVASPAARPAPTAPSSTPAMSSAPSEIRPAPMENRQTTASNNKNNKRILTVGNDILLKGEIATCDRLVIEGMVDATLKDVHTVEISETGSFKGTAEIQDAEISGLFEGDLTVRNRLTIYATGRVRGTISYGEIEIERGGQLTGQIKLEGDSGSDSKKENNSKKEAA